MSPRGGRWAERPAAGCARNRARPCPRRPPLSPAAGPARIGPRAAAPAWRAPAAAALGKPPAPTSPIYPRPLGRCSAAHVRREQVLVGREQRRHRRKDDHHDSPPPRRERVNKARGRAGAGGAGRRRRGRRLCAWCARGAFAARRGGRRVSGARRGAGALPSKGLPGAGVQLRARAHNCPCKTIRAAAAASPLAMRAAPPAPHVRAHMPSAHPAVCPSLMGPACGPRRSRACPGRAAAAAPRLQHWRRCSARMASCGPGQAACPIVAIRSLPLW